VVGPGEPGRLSIARGEHGIAGLAESGVMLDPHGQESSPVIAWFDERGGAELKALDPAFLAEFPRRTGLPIGSQSTLAKLLWLRGPGWSSAPVPGGSTCPSSSPGRCAASR
jgi:hypothetical protein